MVYYSTNTDTGAYESWTFPSNEVWTEFENAETSMKMAQTAEYTSYINKVPNSVMHVSVSTNIRKDITVEPVTDFVKKTVLWTPTMHAESGDLLPIIKDLAQDAYTGILQF